MPVRRFEAGVFALRKTLLQILDARARACRDALRRTENDHAASYSRDLARHRQTKDAYRARLDFVVGGLVADYDYDYDHDQEWEWKEPGLSTRVATCSENNEWKT